MNTWTLKFGRLALASGLALAVFAAASPAVAQPDVWPAHALRLIVPFPPGGAADSIARALSTKLSERLGQPVVVENKPGGGTIVAAQAAAQAAPDGYTLSLATNGQLSINPALHAKLPYDPVKSFAPVALVASTAYIIAVNAASPIQSLPQLVAEAKRQPGAFAFTSCGNGTTCHLTGELLKLQTGTDMLHVPFAGSVQAVTAVVGNQVQIASDTVAILAPQIRAGKLRGLVVSSAQRSAVTPDVPSATEVGLPEFLSDSWFGVVVPAATPPELVQRLNREITTITQSTEMREQFARLGVDPLQSTPDQFARVIDSDLVKWGRIVRSAKVTAQ